jgi:glycerol-3-phosphate acyltransferase PlsY
MILVYLILAILAYLIGSFLPGYFIAKAKGIDIFKKGYKLPGASNVKKVLGTKYAIITGAYDFLKPIILFLILILIDKYINLNDWFIFFLPFLVIIGHMFPFYLKFKGGHGLASCFGFMFFLYFYLLFKNLLNFYLFLLFLALSLVLFFILKRNFSTQVGCLGAIYLFLILTLIEFRKEVPYFVLFILQIFMIFNVTFFDFLEKTKKKKIKRDKTIWRKFLRPLASIFPLGYFFFPLPTLILALFLLFCFLIMEALKYLRKKFTKYVYREKEKRRISSFVYFFIAVVICLYFFNKIFSTFSLFILILSDLFAFALGTIYGKKKIGEKSIFGSIVFFLSSFLIALAYYKFLNFNLLYSVPTILIATIMEILPIKIDDNLAIPISICIFLTIMQKILQAV